MPTQVQVELLCCIVEWRRASSQVGSARHGSTPSSKIKSPQFSPLQNDLRSLLFCLKKLVYVKKSIILLKGSRKHPQLKFLVTDL